MSQDNEKDAPVYVEQHDAARPSTGNTPGEKMTVSRYLATRIPTLKPPMDPLENPFKLLALLNFKQWMFFLVAFIGWTWDAFDFFTVSLTVSDLAETFDKSNTAITWGITLVLMWVMTAREHSSTILLTCS